MNTETTSTNAIDINEAIDWAKRYQKDHNTGAKAFLIPILDLLESMEEMGVIAKDADGKYDINEIKGACVRAYLAVDPNEINNEANGEKLLIVGTKQDENGIHRDIVQNENSTTNTSLNRISSGVFDFTEPCPSYCDIKSPLV